jgi:hypothetical protein
MRGVKYQALSLGWNGISPKTAASRQSSSLPRTEENGIPDTLWGS